MLIPLSLMEALLLMKLLDLRIGSALLLALTILVLMEAGTQEEHLVGALLEEVIDIAGETFGPQTRNIGIYGTDNVNEVDWHGIGDINRNVVEQQHSRCIHPRKLIDLPEFNGIPESWPVFSTTFTDRLTDWQTDRLTDWQTDRLTDW